MRRPNFRFDAMLGKRSGDPRGAIVCVSSIGKMLQLASAALREETAGRLLLTRTVLKRAVIEYNVAWNRERDMAAA